MECIHMKLNNIIKFTFYVKNKEIKFTFKKAYSINYLTFSIIFISRFYMK